jgi:hypothetical protein
VTLPGPVGQAVTYVDVSAAKIERALAAARAVFV